MCGGVCVCGGVLTAWHYANKRDLQLVVSSIAKEAKIFDRQRRRGYAKCLLYSLVQDDSLKKRKNKENYTTHARKIKKNHTQYKQAWKIYFYNI